MSERDFDGAHREGWDDELAAYALHALDEPEAAEVERHLDGCAECRQRLLWLEPAVDVLPASVAQQEPPPGLRTRLMEIVEREAADPVAAAEVERRSRRRFRLPGLGEMSLRPALAGLAVVLVVAAGVVGYAVRDGDGDGGDVQTYAAEGTGPASLATGTLEVEGDQGSLTVRNLPATRPGEVYQAWIQHIGPDGRIEPSSVFVVADDGSGHVALPHGLNGAERVMITREPEGGSAKPHESPLLTAEMN